MQVEVTAAINLIAASLYNKLPRRRVDAFAEEVEKGIVAKFQGHWYPDNPSKGAAYRCLNVSGEKVDPVIIYAVINSGLDVEEVGNYLPKDLTIWIDPGEVSFSIGEKGQVRLLYSERRSTNLPDENITNPQPISFTSLPVTTSSSSVMSSPLGSPDELTSNLSSSFGSLSLSSAGSSSANATTTWGTTPSPIPWPSASNSSSINPWTPMSPQKPASFSSWSTGTTFNNIMNNQPAAFPVQTAPRANNNNNKTMTAAMFAQTKFGSTKLKNHTKRSNRLSPTENFVRSQGSSNYSRQSPTMNSAFLDRMQMHMQQPMNNNDFPIDHFKMGGNSNRTADKFNMSTSNNNMGSINGTVGRYSPCTIGSLAGIFSTDQDWVDLSDVAVHSNGNQLLAA